MDNTGKIAIAVGALIAIPTAIYLYRRNVAPSFSIDEGNVAYTFGGTTNGYARMITGNDNNSVIKAASRPNPAYPALPLLYQVVGEFGRGVWSLRIHDEDKTTYFDIYKNDVFQKNLGSAEMVPEHS